MMIRKNKNTLKYVSLITLTLQNAVLALSMRYARTRKAKEDLFISTTAVFMAEWVKLITCLVIVFYTEAKNLDKFLIALHKTVFENLVDTLKVCVPSLLYVIQNNLLYVSASNLDAATNQVSYQLKILTTAIFAVIILRKKLFSFQWISLFILIGGVALVHLADQKETSVKNVADQNRILGFSAVMGACVLSGLAGIFFEKMLKGADISVWMRNVQMSLLSIPLALATCLISDYSKVSNVGFFHGYDFYVIYLILLQAMGGLLVAMVVKYADNILKGFATSLSIIISCVASMYIFDFQLTYQFAAGAALVIGAIFLYGYTPKNPNMTNKKASNMGLDESFLDHPKNEKEATDKV